jgi:hypothetical protein
MSMCRGYLSGLLVISRRNILGAREITLGGKFLDGWEGKWVGVGAPVAKKVPSTLDG